MKDMTGKAPESQLQAALDIARRTWLNAATVNAGGRWAVVPAAAAALGGVVLATTGETRFWPLALVSALGLAGVAAALILTRQSFARPGRPGAPDYAILLDRALGLNDSLPAWLEAPGRFAEPLHTRLLEQLQPVRIEACAPPRQWSALAVALVLCLLPLAALTAEVGLDSAVPPQGSQTARQPVPEPEPEPELPPPPPLAPEPESPQDPQPGPAAQGGGNQGEGGKPSPNPGEVPGEAPADQPRPKPEAGNPPPNPTPSGTGDQTGPPPKPEEPKGDDPLDSSTSPITPDATEGESRKELRSRWMYNPEGAPLPGARPNPPPLPAGGEREIGRQKVTSGERKRLESLYEKLYR